MPGGSSSAVATAGTVLASVTQPLCTVNRKCTAMTYSVNRINAENGVHACGQSSTVVRSASIRMVARTMISSAYRRTGRGVGCQARGGAQQQVANSDEVVVGQPGGLGNDVAEGAQACFGVHGHNVAQHAGLGTCLGGAAGGNVRRLRLGHIPPIRPNHEHVKPNSYCG